MENTSVAERIRSKYVTFSRSERSIADFLLGTQHHLSAYTATELAREASVSKATVTRFMNKLGFETFQDFRKVVRKGRHMIVGSPIELLERGLAATEGNLQVLFDETLRTDQTNLSQTYANLELSQVAEVVEYFAGARRLIFADFRKQYALAYYAATLFRTIRPDVSSLPMPGASPVDNMIDLGPEDVVVMFPFRRPMREQNILSNAVAESSATLIAIGDIWPTPPTQKALIHLRCFTESPGVFDSFVAPMSLINMLFSATANVLGDTAKTRLTELEHRHLTFETFMDGYNTVVKHRDIDGLETLK